MDHLTCIDLRILTYIECIQKVDKINEITNFLAKNDFIISELIIKVDGTTAQDIQEQSGISSLTIELDPNINKIRYKYWTGAETYWINHTQELFTSLVEGRNEFDKLSMKYALITDIIERMKSKFDKDIVDVLYNYYPGGDAEIGYLIIFSAYVKEHGMEARLLEDINNEISLLGDNVLSDVNFVIDFDFEKVGCTSCEEAKKREENERKNKKSDADKSL